MTKLRFQKTQNIALAALLVLPLLVTTAIFITNYCHLFDGAGLLAKKRLLDHPAISFCVTPLFFWMSAYLCRRYSPNAAGDHFKSAVTQLKKDPNDFEKLSAFLNIRLVIVKTVSSLLSSFGGGALGKEGPSVHMSAGIFAIFANAYAKFLPKINLDAWVISGSAVGLTLAFNAPIAGIIFAVEKISRLGHTSFKRSVLLALTSVAIVTIIFHQTAPIFAFHEVNFAVKRNWWWLILTAAICGILALTFKAISNFLYLKIAGIKSNLWHIIPLALGLAAACVNFYSGIFSFSGGIQTIQAALSSDVTLLSYREVGGRILNTILSFSSGSAGGLIAPSMAIGAGIGSIASVMNPSADIGIFLLIGMVAFLSVVLGEPISAAIIVFEVTGQNIHVLPFLLSATIISSWLAHQIKYLLTLNFLQNDKPNF